MSDSSSKGTELADRIKALHSNLRLSMEANLCAEANARINTNTTTTTSTSPQKDEADGDDDADNKTAEKKNTGAADERAWAALKQDEASLQQYASDMFTLATKHWRHEDETQQHQLSGADGLHTNRLAYIADVIKSYFCCSETAPGAPAPEQQHSLPARRERDHGDDGGDNVVSGAEATAQEEQKQQQQQQVTSTTTAMPTVVPGIIAGPLKKFRRESWQTNSCAPTDAECRNFADTYVAGLFCGRGRAGVAAAAATSHEAATDELRIVDIGSCYNPLREYFPPSTTTTSEKRQHLKFWPMIAEEDKWRSWDPVVVGLDLYPHKGNGVFRCDWHDIEASSSSSSSQVQNRNNREFAAAEKMFELPPELTSSCLEFQKDGDKNTQQQQEQRDKLDQAMMDFNIAKFHRGTAHCVVFCLMLSYLPSAQMRLRCCWHAHQFLADDGLFIVASTRTQGSRKSKWEEQWAVAIEKLGFERYRKDIRIKLVGLAFRKLPGSGVASFEELPEALRMQGLSIRADEAL